MFGCKSRAHCRALACGCGRPLRRFFFQLGQLFPQLPDLGVDLRQSSRRESRDFFQVLKIGDLRLDLGDLVGFITARLASGCILVEILLNPAAQRAAASAITAG